MIITSQRQGETVREYACRVIKENIITMELKPGSLVSETELAKELGVSRTPVREALIQLGKNNMVEIFPQRGTKVSLIDTACVEESRFYRLVIEKALVQEICNNCNEGDLFPLSENIHNQLFCLENRNVHGIVDADNAFHKLLYKIADKDRSYDALNNIFTQFDRVRYLSAENFNMDVVVSEHRALYEAMKNKENEKADAIITEHLSRYKEDMLALKERFPEYFK